MECGKDYFWRNLVLWRIALRFIDYVDAVTAQEAEVARQSGVHIEATASTETGDRDDRFTLADVLIEPAQSKGVVDAQRPLAERIEGGGKNNHGIGGRPDIGFAGTLEFAPDLVPAHQRQARLINKRARAGRQNNVNIPTGSLGSREKVVDQRRRGSGATDEIEGAASRLFRCGHCHSSLSSPK